MRRLFRHALGAALGLTLATVVHGQSLSQIRQAAENGEVVAQMLLAGQYDRGENVLQSYTKAALWYERAAAQGQLEAKHRLATLLILGLGVDPNPARGIELLEEAKALGSAEVFYDLARAYQQGVGATADLGKAIVNYEMAADLGHEEATVSLGVMHQSGRGTPVDLTRAIELYTGPAEAGNARAQNNLGLIYIRGEGVARDDVQAFNWFQRAAAQGLVPAMRNLASMYQNGFGTEVDEPRSEELLRAAATQGAGQGIGLVFDDRLKPLDLSMLDEYARDARHGDPIANLYFAQALMAQDADPDARRFRQAAAAYEVAARKGLPAAMANLGLMMFEGRGVLQDFGEGYAWLTVAASMGRPDVLETRDLLAGSMTVDQVNLGQALAERLWAEFAQ